MKEHPILFSDEMVRAILEGRKTQTRRVVKPQPYITTRAGTEAWQWDHGPKGGYTTWRTDLSPLTFTGMAIERRPSPYGKPGDRLWVRETWGVVDEYGSTKLPMFEYTNGRGELYKTVRLYHRADGERTDTLWRPSIHMPRWASRLTLEIVSVRVERLQEISEADCIAEGIIKLPATGRAVLSHGAQYFGDCWNTCREAYRALWDSINAKRGFGWDTNPWVWAIEFRRVIV